MARKLATRKKKSDNVEVKKGGDVLSALNRHLAYNLHDRYNLSFSSKTQQKMVAYGPWLAILSVVVLMPQLLILSKSGQLISFSGFFETILFNQESWVILIILFSNILLLVDGIGHLFAKERKGWTRIYQATLVTSGYIIWQLLANLSQPAAALLSLLATIFVLFTLLDIRSYYR